MEEEKYTITEEFLEDIEKDTKINDLDLRSEAMMAVNKTQRYIEELYRAKRKLYKLELHRKKIEGELFQKYKTGTADIDLRISSSQDIMRFVYRDKKYQTAANLYKELETLVDFLENTVKNMSQRPWLIQKLIDMDKNG